MLTLTTRNNSIELHGYCMLFMIDLIHPHADMAAELARRPHLLRQPTRRSQRKVGPRQVPDDGVPSVRSQWHHVYTPSGSACPIHFLGEAEQQISRAAL